MRFVADASACTPSSFYLSGDRAVLCPDVCARVKADPEPKLRVYVGCLLPILVIGLRRARRAPRGG